MTQYPISLLPSSPESERAILGGILLDNKAYDEAQGLGLVIEDFSLDSNRRIFRHFVLLAESSSAIDLVTVIQSLTAHKELAAVGDLGYVSALVEGVPDRPTIKAYVKIVKEASAKRALYHACIAITGDSGASMTSGEGIAYLSEKMLQIQTGSNDAPARRVIEFSDETYAKWLQVAEGSSDLIGLPTGVASLDMSTTGLREKELWCIGGRTGDGKTNLALQMAAANCREGIPVGIFSVEMPKESLLHRLWAGEAQVDARHVRFPRWLKPEVKSRIKQAMVEVGKWPLHVVEESGIAIQKLIAKAKLMVRREGVRLIVVDYAQIVTAQGRDERERITKVSKALQGLAKETGAAVVVLSQLARPKEGNENNRPVKYNLKESGSLDNDADVIVLIYRPVDDRKMKTGEDELIVDKQRSGLPSIEQVTFLPWLRFAERTNQ